MTATYDQWCWQNRHRVPLPGPAELEAPCPACRCPVHTRAYEDGVSVWHRDPWGPDCQRDINRIMDEADRKHGLRGALRSVDGQPVT